MVHVMIHRMLTGEWRSLSIEGGWQRSRNKIAHVDFIRDRIQESMNLEWMLHFLLCNINLIYSLSFLFRVGGSIEGDKLYCE